MSSPVAPRSPGPDAPRSRRAGVALLVLLGAAVPWAWFPLRDPLGLVGDMVAIVLPVLVVVIAAGAVLVGRRRGVLPAVSVLLAGTVAVIGPWTPAETGVVAPGHGVTVAGANLTGTTETVPALRGVDADVLVVAENTVPVHRQLTTTYGFHATPMRVPPAVGVYSRYPVRLLDGPGPDFPGIRVAVDAPTPFVVYALHVPKPWWPDSVAYHTTPADHHRLVEEVAARAALEREPVVLVGDLNSTDRARDYRLLTTGIGLTDVMRDGWAGPTSVTTWRPFLLRIDHLLVSPGWCGDAARRFTLPGSDHDGVTATVGPCTTPSGP